MTGRFVLCVLCLALPAGARAAAEMLPDNVLPVHYELSVAPDPDRMAWRGELAVAIDVKHATTDIVLNSAGLAFDRVALDGGRNGTVRVDAKLGRATLHFAKTVAPGRHALAIDYRGRIARETLGFFAMDYTTPYGPRRTLATNFEPAYARRFLPCWDEPARKATFRLTVDTPNNRVAVSNMPIEWVKLLTPTVKRVRFQTTPRMSTYLLFLAIGDFQRISREVDGVNVGVLVKRGDTTKGAYALGEATRLLHYYDDYFGYPYPLPKLDLVAAPGTIDGGSMENWGAIFYSQDELLFDRVTSTESELQGVFETVAHEMSHQWFGDLVTMAWWDNLWLNEGFARWMQTYAADALHPEWKTGLQAQSIFERGKDADAERDTHPIVQPVETAAQADLAFNAITYNKGAAVITMLNAYIGPDAFREGVRRYMRAHAFGNTVDTDLWSIMQTVAGKPILQIEHDFTRQEGLPLLRVSETAEGLHLAQDRFFADPSEAARANAQQWIVPLAIATHGLLVTTLLREGTANVPAHPPILVNAGQTAYTRVLYTEAAFDALLRELSHLNSVDQLGLVNDANAFGLAGYGPLSNLFALVEKLPPGADPIIWRRIAQLVTALDRRYADTPARAAFRNYVRRLLLPILARIGTSARPGEDANAPLLRIELTETLGYLGDGPVIDHARRTLAKRGGSADERRAALDVSARQADAAAFEELLHRARKTQDPLEKQHLYDALGGVQDPALARRMVAIALGPEVAAGSNLDILLHLAQNHPDLVWREGVPHFGDPAAGISKGEQWDAAATIAGLSADPARVADAETYETRNVPADARRPFIGAIASIHRNARIATQILPRLDRWIADQMKR